MPESSKRKGVGQKATWATIILALIALVGQWVDSRTRTAELEHKARMAQIESMETDQSTQDAVRQIWKACREDHDRTQVRINYLEFKIWSLVIAPRSETGEPWLEPGGEMEGDMVKPPTSGASTKSKFEGKINMREQRAVWSKEEPSK